MPTPAVSLKIRKFRRRFGITAPKLVVRSHFPWPWMISAGLLVMMVTGGLFWKFGQQSETGEMAREIHSLRLQLQEYGDELNMLRSTAGTGQNAASIERATQQRLLARIQNLERENSALKEDMLLFERLIPVIGEGGAVRVESFRVMRDGGGRYRYRILLAFQPDKQNSEFRGHLQLAVAYVADGKTYQSLFPEKGAPMGEYHLELKHFLRREGMFELPSSAQVTAVEARVLQGDTLKSKRLAQL